MRKYFVEVQHTVVELFRIDADSEKEARDKAKSNDFEPFETIQKPYRVTAAWPLGKQED